MLVLEMWIAVPRIDSVTESSMCALANKMMRAFLNTHYCVDGVYPPGTPYCGPSELAVKYVVYFSDIKASLHSHEQCQKLRSDLI